MPTPSFGTIQTIQTTLPFSNDNPSTNEDVVPEAVVSVGNVVPDGQLSAFADPEINNDFTIFTDYMVHSHYEKDGHVYMMGVTTPSPASFPTGFPSVSFVQLAAPTLLWIADWTASKFYSQPEIPNPYPDARSPWVLLDEHYEPVMITTGPDGNTPLYRLSGTFVYGHPSPSAITIQDISFGKPPWLLNVFDRSMPVSKLRRGIIDNRG